MLELFYILIVGVVTPFVCLSKLKERHAKKDKSTVSKFHLSKLDFSKSGRREQSMGSMGTDSPAFILSLSLPLPLLWVHPSPVLSEPLHPWYMFNSHVKRFRRVIYIQKKALHLFQKDLVSKAGPPYSSSFLQIHRKCYSSSSAWFIHVPHMRSGFTAGCKEGGV